MRKKSIIKMSELPLRPARINPNEMTNIYGGCVGEGNRCENCSCCGSLVCVSHPAWGQREFKCEKGYGSEWD